MAIVRNRECCYWKKPQCNWEHCAEITGQAISSGNRSEYIKENQHCGNMAFEEILLKMNGKSPASIGEALLDFIEDGSFAINEYCKR